MFRRTWTRMFIVVVLALIAASTAQAAPPPGAGRAEVRVAHFSPDAPNVDVYVDGNLALSNVPYTAVSDYLSIRPGRHTFAITPAGSSTVVLQASATLEPGRAYTVAATDTLSSIDATIYSDDVCAPAAGNAKVRAIHAAPDVPAVDVTLPDGTVLIPGLQFPNASEYLEVPAGTYTLQVRLAGTDTVALEITATVEAGKSYSIAALGTLDGSDDAALMLMPYADRTFDDQPLRGPRADICG
jgi:hypothetical protein